jgi:DNA polymerase-3 subunit chi
MTRIDFAFGAPDRLRTACELVAKHYQAKQPIVVYCQDTALLEQLNCLLWEFEPTAFVPHAYVDDPLAAQAPVLLTGSRPVAPSTEKPAWLLNLDSQCPPSMTEFGRVLEIVSQDDENVVAARQRWKQYKALGYDVHAHDISPTDDISPTGK